ncbi:MAG: DUF4159 domain-containing protein [Hyphomicrobiales bacterium]|nr:DUF4159 domain-containing protein [Hyphomicrobiales bacterium]
MTLFSIAFTSPWLLAGLAALPVIWYLLRFTPPAPTRVEFPAARLLLGVNADERTAARSPWWLTALRLFAAAMVIMALAGPIHNPRQTLIAGDRPLLLVVDNGWAAAGGWPMRRRLMDEAIREAETTGRSVYIAATADIRPDWRPEALTPEKALSVASALQPAPAGVNRKIAADALRAAESGLPPLSVLWISDGVEDGGSQALGDVLSDLSRGGGFALAQPPAGGGALALFATLGADQRLTAKILSTGADARTGVVAALSARGERLGEAAFALPTGTRTATAALNLPVDLQNQVTRLEIAGETSAGAVFLLDGRSVRRRVGVISGDLGEGAQPLLSPTHYIEKALSPFAQVVRPAPGNLDAATAEILKTRPSVIVLADIGRLSEPVEARLRRWVQSGGLLIRFAGPRMEQGADGLLPVRLREGGRMLGGALSWSTPQKLAPFERSSPFHGLTAPPDVEVNRQILADPAAIASPNRIWARLEDGTPLVTSDRLGAGRLALFHVTGHPDWSNLPLSGVFIEMLRRTVEEGAAITPPAAEEAAAPAASPDAAEREREFLPPWRLLDGFGRLAPPPAGAKPVSLEAIGAGAAPPGCYGANAQARAVNIASAATELEPAAAPPDAIAIDASKTGSEPLAPWLFMAALAAFVADALLTLALTAKGGFARAPRGLACLAALGLALIAGPHHEARAEAEPAAIAPETVEAALKTRLAYVLTGDADLDETTRSGLVGLSRVLAARTAMEPAEPMGVNPETDELSVFPLIYWAIPDSAPALTDAAAAKIDAYMKSGGVIIFDTRDYQMPFGRRTPGSGEPAGTALGDMLAKLDIPRLEPVSDEHVITKSFYILRSFPGRWEGGELWVDAQTNVSDTETRRALKSDGVSAILVTSNDLAAAWALDEANSPLHPVAPGGEEQRELAFRAGVNIVMYALTGNYKADQVHVPALLERLGH